MLKRIALLLFLLPVTLHAEEQHGLAIFGDLKYSANFPHFDYVNPNAPKGGEIIFAEIGTFDSLNPYILKGVGGSGITRLLHETLLTKSYDEPFSGYGLIAESVEIAEDKSSVTFTLRKEARWHDNTPITADDVIFSFNALMKDGHPFYRTYYIDVERCEKIHSHKVRFVFKTNKNREIPTIIGDMPILPKHFYDTHEFNKTTLEIPLGSGAYEIAKVDAGKSIVYKRKENYWGKDLAVNIGRYNFDTIRYDYYRDSTVAVEALKAGEYDLRQENISRIWATAYDFKARDDGVFIKNEIMHQIPSGMQGFVINTRRDKFKDIRIRKALNYTFDFEWANKTLFYSAYKRTKSYFANSIYESSGVPEGAELEVLKQYKNQLPSDIFTTEYEVPTTDGTGWARDNLKQANALFKEAGYRVVDNQLVDENGTPLEIEFLLHSPSFKRVVAPMIRNLKKLGIKSKIRLVDPAQYIERAKKFDFDILVTTFGASLAPGSELRDTWHSSNVNVKGGQNIAGVNDSTVDALVERIIEETHKETYIALLKALDRVLLHGYYVVPNWYNQSFRMIYWNKFSHPKTPPKYARGIIDTWWVDAEKLETVKEYKLNR